MARGVGKAVVLMAGLGVAGVAVAAMIFWKDIAVQYHLHRLRREPADLLAWIEWPEGTLERKAVRHFLKSPAGARALLSAYLRLLGRSSPPLEVRLNDIEKALLGIGAASRAGDDGFFWSCWRQDGEEKSQVHVFPKEGSHQVRVLEEVLGEVAGREIILPAHSSLRFCFLPRAEAYEAYGVAEIRGPFRQPGSPGSLYGKRLICLVRRLPSGTREPPLE